MGIENLSIRALMPIKERDPHSTFIIISDEGPHENQCRLD